jgi:hypothetical protein
MLLMYLEKLQGQMRNKIFFPFLMLEFLFQTPSTIAAMNLEHQFEGEIANSDFGWRALLADTDGDGNSEVIISAPSATIGDSNGGSIVGAGAVYIYRATGELIQRLEGDQTNEQFGDWIVGKDLNADGKAELIVGAPRHSATPDHLEGAVFIFSYISPTADFPNGIFVQKNRLDGEYSSSRLGRVISTMGDLDGDGVDEILIGAPFNPIVGNPFGGAAYIISGKKAFDGASMVQGGALIRRWDGERETNLFASCLTGLGDLDGDGIPDLAVSVATDGPADQAEGWAFIFSGAKVRDGASFNDALLFKIAGAEPDQWLGNVVGHAGDLDGDGVSDLIVGAPGSREEQIGAVYLYSGKKTKEYFDSLGQKFDPSNPSLIGTSALILKIAGETANDNFGYSLATIGDFNGDGALDFIVGAHGAFSEECSSGQTSCIAGKAYLYSGTSLASASSTSSLLGTVSGSTSGEEAGRFVSGNGTMNGHPVVLVAAPKSNNRAGKAYLLSSDAVIQENTEPIPASTGHSDSGSSSTVSSSPPADSSGGANSASDSASTSAATSSASDQGNSGFGCNRDRLAQSNSWDAIAALILIGFPLWRWILKKGASDLIKSTYPIVLLISVYLLSLSSAAWGAGNQVNKTLTINTGMGVNNGSNKNLFTKDNPETQCAGLGPQKCEKGPFTDTSNPFSPNHDCSDAVQTNPNCVASYDPELPGGFVVIDNRFGRGAPCGPDDVNGPPFPYPCHTTGSINQLVPLGMDSTDTADNGKYSTFHMPPSLGAVGQPFYQYRSDTFGNLRVNHIEYGFDQNVQTESPQIMRIFFIVDSTTDANGQIVGNAVGSYRMTITDGSGAKCNVTTSNASSEGMFEAGSTGVITCVDRAGNVCQSVQFRPGKFSTQDSFVCPP